MRVLYIHQYFNTRTGSSGTRSYEFARALIGAGHIVTMLCASTAGCNTGLGAEFTGNRRSGIVDGIDVVEFRIDYSNHNPIYLRALKFLKFAWKCSLEVFSRDFDIVVATSTPLTVVIPGAIAQLFRRKPFVFEVRDLWPELPKALGLANPAALIGMKVLEWIGYRTATRIIALAPGILRGVAKAGVNPELIDMIPNGCDFDVFEAAPILPPCQRFPGHIATGDFVALFAGAHGKANGLAAVLDAAEELRRLGRGDIKFLLIGEGTEKPALVTRATITGLSNVIFAPPIPKTELASLMLGADLALQILADVPAFYDGTSPNKFFDYLASGRPVLINYPGWLAKLIEDGRCGYVVPPRDPLAFAAALVRAADDREGRLSAGACATLMGRKLFDRARLAKEFVECLVRAQRQHSNI
ncbi:MAG: glycosyltransferase family 4 protein [Micropepsaceae bacterium]